MHELCEESQETTRELGNIPVDPLLQTGTAVGEAMERELCLRSAMERELLPVYQAIRDAFLKRGKFRAFQINWQNRHARAKMRPDE